MSPILLVITSMTGNTKTFIDFLKTYSERPIVICEDFSRSIKDYEKIGFGAYTWGNGKIPQRMKSYLIKHKDNFRGKEVFIFGSGNSIYPRFCGAVDGINKIVSDCGAIVKGTFKFEQRFNKNDYTQEEINHLINTIKEWSR
jgi:flavodoxin I